MSTDQPATASTQFRDTSPGMGGVYGAAAIALVAMGLLAFGYSQNKGVDVAQTAPSKPAASTLTATPAPPPAPATNSSQTTGAATSSPDSQKPYQPQAPAPDTRAAPTSSSTGQAEDNGGRPEAAPK